MSAPVVRLPPTVELYRPACERILGWLARNWVDQDLFDELATLDLLARRPFRGHGRLADAIVLPSVMGDPMGDHLAVLQELVCDGIVATRERHGFIEYCAARPTPP